MAEQPEWLKGKGFKKGVAANPLGNRRTPKEFQIVKKLTQKELAEMATLLLDNDMNTLRIIAAKERGQSFWPTAIARVVTNAYDKADWFVLDKLLDRIIGKVKEVTEVQLPRPTIIQIEQDRQIVLGATFKAVDDFEAPPPVEVGKFAS
jgi:hypothetical protein